MPQRPVRDYMTPLPHVIEAEQPLAEAERRMRQLGVRHLPVVEQGELVGVLSERDLGRAARGDVDPETAPVEEAMTAEPYAVDPEVALATVARQMAAQRVGSAVIVEGDEVVGLFTSTDALVLLSDLLLGFFAPRLDALAPSEVAERLRGEHAVLGELLERVDETVARVEAGEEAVDQELTYLSRELYTLRLRHHAVVGEILPGALREAGAPGRRHAETLEAEHEDRRKELVATLRRLDAADDDDALTGAVKSFCAHVRADLDTERELLALLKDQAVHVDQTTS